MASLLFQYARKELAGLFARQNVRFATDFSSSSPVSSPSGNNLTDTERRVRTVFKAFAAFVPGVFLGHWLGRSMTVTPTDAKKDDEESKDNQP
ncbi:hypothetical protein NPIL_82361 [Nephila pilipes]|uniref:Uncharacterized protein n=1 Tax=Nephila pilipes TaxID=299642 RepID=A0A8X6R4Y0_NEPPI|nr:hypothetical protein NPIL_82361 [Nephila pilipes]